jgi:uncharacterized protein (DUF488 family)
VAATLYTIGFTKSTAERFFTRLRDAGVRRLVDIRLNNTSTLAGFTKRDDIAFFLRTVWKLNIEYVHEPLLCPTEDLLKGIQSKQISWDEYEARYNALIRERDVANVFERATFEGPTVLLCSEPTAEQCHRRLAAEHLARAWGNLDIVHL